MLRLVQGDVGCGKTIVAALAMAYVVANKYQAALMVPTEVLAGQHFFNLKNIFEPLGWRVALLTGSLSAKEKREILSGLASGEIQICIGTHALIQDEVEFKALAMVVVDEQHRFGVNQRSHLKGKGKMDAGQGDGNQGGSTLNPHFLVMTATPIPRNFAMTA